ncbi:hypothetical protein BC829DRAFT_379173 [Chytridium lagenaria]|nr:hypothetical protein BC829DRAFT_379173 [Chytridium lagenaria]
MVVADHQNGINVHIKSEDIFPFIDSGVSIGTDTATDDSEDSHDEIFRFADSGMVGDWEKYTKGIASKYFAKMGSSGQGIVRPIEAQILPAGRGLGFEPEMTSRTEQKPDVFDFLNNALAGKKSSDALRLVKSTPPKVKSDVLEYGQKKSAKAVKADEESSARVELLGLSKKESALRTEMSKLKDLQAAYDNVKLREDKLQAKLQGDKLKSKMVSF